MTGLPIIPLSADATKLFASIAPKIKEELAQIKSIPVSVLLWGPDPLAPAPISQLRLSLREALRKDGHAAFCSEEICDMSLPYSIRIQELAQAHNFELIVSIPCTPGSIAEIHDFAIDKRVNGRMIVFLNKQYIAGYSNQSILSVSSVISCKVSYYENEKDTLSISNVVYEQVKTIREIKYLTQGMY